MWGTEWCVRDNAAGASNGTDWTNAWEDMSDITWGVGGVARGDAIYVADGTYSGDTFDLVTDGTTVVTILKATESAHGAETGWDSAYGDGLADFGGSIQFSTPYWVFDGVTGGGPSSWETGFGFRVWLDYVSNNNFFIFQTSGSNVTVSHTEIGNSEPPGAGCDRAAYSAQGADNITFSYCYVHYIGDVGMTILNSSGWAIEYSRLTNLCETGAVPEECGGGESHGAGIELSGTTLNFTIRYNKISNCTGTGWIGIYDTGSGYVDGLYIYGNLFLCTSGYTEVWGNGVVYNVSGTTEPIKNIKIYNNTFVNLTCAPLLGLTKDTGMPREHEDSEGNEFINNIVYNTAVAPYYVISTLDYNASDDSISGDSHFQTLTSDPFVNSVTEDYHLAGATDAGVDLGSPYNIDMDGETRGAVGVWDRGTYDYIGGGAPPGAPFASDLVMILSVSITIILSGWLYALVTITNRFFGG